MFSEVRTDYRTGTLFGIETRDEGYLGRISIDAWRTESDSEQGEVIAAVLMSPHGDILVEWHDNSARYAVEISDAIAEAKADLLVAFSTRNCDTEPIEMVDERKMERALAVLMEGKMRNLNTNTNTNSNSNQKKPKPKHRLAKFNLNRWLKSLFGI